MSGKTLIRLGLKTANTVESAALLCQLIQWKLSLSTVTESVNCSEPVYLEYVLHLLAYRTLVRLWYLQKETDQIPTHSVWYHGPTRKVGTFSSLTHLEINYHQLIYFKNKGQIHCKIEQYCFLCLVRLYFLVNSFSHVHLNIFFSAWKDVFFVECCST